MRANAASPASVLAVVDVIHPNADKGRVVDFHAGTLGIPAGAIVTIGDVPDDVRTFKKGCTSIAMGNGSEQVQHGAGAVSDSYDDEGFAKAVEQFIRRSDAYHAVAEAE
jgi:hydroxymethylpyrimidine pyrophosphatase-like HAD family hydrolase